jgi:hypothetical protein
MDSSKKWKASTGEEVKFKRKHSKPNRISGTDTYEEWKAPSAKAAKEYLNTRTITEKQYYLVVLTPEGNWGKDILGVYKE